MKKVSVYLKNLKKLQNYEAVTIGRCPETGLENRVLTCRVGHDIFTRKIDRIDWAAGDYVTFMYGETENPEILEMHDPSLKDG